MKPLLIGALIAVFSLGVVLAQEQTETPTPSFGPVLDDVLTAEVEEVISPADARVTTCTAPTLPNFRPYVIRPGDRLGDLLAGVDNLTVTQLALLNCLDDPSALPVGATIWLPLPSATATEAPEATAEATAERTPVTQAEIHSLTSSSEPVQNLEGTTFRWEATGLEAYFYSCPADPAVECLRPVGANPVPLRGSMTVRNFHYAGPARYRLEVIGADDSLVEDITVNVVCSQESLGLVTGNPHCAETPPRATFAAWQPFEGGVMLYFADTGEIWVLTNADNRVRVYRDAFVEGMPEPEISNIPENRFAARRGFGIVWRQLGGPESPLGWALAEEIGFDSARQPAGRVSFTTYIQGPGDTVYAVTQVPGMAEGFWTQVAG
ncbi:MAG: hypothetical protein DIU68_017225 [Chloroflexota bacterium]|nr:MAG: hypothetical protein DIU68_06925 [Chloroflexota bacterium]